MTNAQPRGPGSLISACYCVGVLLIGVSMLDFAGTVLPADLSDAGWRYGAIGLLSGFTLTPLLGGLLLALAAATAGHRRTLGVLGWGHVIAGAGLLLLTAGFSLDALQVRRDLAPDSQNVTEVSSLKALVKLTATVIGLVWVGVAAIRGSRKPAAPSQDSGGLLVSR